MSKNVLLVPPTPIIHPYIGGFCSDVCFGGLEVWVFVCIECIQSTHLVLPTCVFVMSTWIRVLFFALKLNQACKKLHSTKAPICSFCCSSFSSLFFKPFAFPFLLFSVHKLMGIKLLLVLLSFLKWRPSGDPFDHLVPSLCFA